MTNVSILTLLLVLALVVIVRRGRKITDYFLFATILAIAGYIASDIWVNQSINHHSFAFHSIASFFHFLPILFYGILLISKHHQIKKSWWKFTVFHICYMFFIVGDIYFWNDYTISDIKNLYVDPPWPYHFFYKGLHIYIISMMIWFLGKLRNYQSSIQDYYSNIEEIDLNWLKYFSWVFIIVYATSLVTQLSYNFGFIKDIEIPYLVIGISILFSLLWMIYNGLNQYSLANFSEPETLNKPKKKYATSSLSTEDAKDLFHSIRELFEKDQIYHQPDLKVQDLARQLGVTNHNISQALNEAAGKSFYDFVNDYRLQYFQKQLADPKKKQFTILALGMDSGFNSKASINRVFKKRLGETPRQYQQRMLSKNQSQALTKRTHISG